MHSRLMPVVRQRKPRRDKPIPVALKPELIARIDALATRLGENRSVVMRMAMRIGLERLEESLRGTTQPISGYLLNDKGNP